MSKILVKYFENKELKKKYVRVEKNDFENGRIHFTLNEKHYAVNPFDITWELKSSWLFGIPEWFRVVDLTKYYGKDGK